MVEYSEFMINAVGAFLIIVIGLVLGKIISNFLKRFIKSLEISDILRKELKLKLPIENYIALFFKYLIYILAFLMALAQFDIPSRTLRIIVIVIVIGIVLFVLLAFKDWIPNLVSGLYILKTKKIKIGDTIEIKGLKGKIENIGLLETKIKTEKEEVFIPNSILTKEQVKKIRR